MHFFMHSIRKYSKLIFQMKVDFIMINKLFLNTLNDVTNIIMCIKLNFYTTFYTRYAVLNVLFLFFAFSAPLQIS